MRSRGRERGREGEGGERGGESQLYTNMLCGTVSINLMWDSLTAHSIDGTLS